MPLHLFLFVLLVLVLLYFVARKKI